MLNQFKLLQISTLIYIGLIVSNVWAEQVPTYGPIKSGDMLWTIAGKVSPPSVDRHQAILALQKANPQAFSVSCNIYSLKVGEVLRIPTLPEMQAISREQAITALKQQEEDWKNRRQKPLICPPIITQTPESTQSSTKVDPEKNASPIKPNRIPIIEGSTSSSVETDTQSPSTKMTTTDTHSQTVTLVPDKQDNEPKSSFSAFLSLIYNSFIIAGLLFVLFLLILTVIWFFKYKRPEQQKAIVASQSTLPDDPSDEMPLPTIDRDEPQKSASEVKTT